MRIIAKKAGPTTEGKRMASGMKRTMQMEKSSKKQKGKTKKKVLCCV